MMKDADLIFADLSRNNLSRADVEKAQFGANVGLTEETYPSPPSDKAVLQLTPPAHPVPESQPPPCGGSPARLSIESLLQLS